MRVLLVQKMAGISGSEKYFLTILPQLRRLGIDASFLVVQHPENAEMNTAFIAELRSVDVPVDIIESRFPISPLLIYRIARLIRHKNFDLLQTNLIHADVWGSCIKKFLLPQLTVVSLKHGYSESFQTAYGLDSKYIKSDSWSILTRWAAKYSDKVVCISAALEKFLVNGGLVDSTKALTIPYGCDFSQVPSLVECGKLRFGNPQLVVPGRVVPVKQHHLLIQVLPEIIKKFPNISVVMVGAGPLLDALRTSTEEMGLSGNVRWEGFRANMHDYLRDSDVSVIPSAAEGFGVVVLESWAHGKPVVCFDVPALNEIINSGQDGILVKPFDTRHLLSSLTDLLSDPEKTKALGAAGKRKQLEIYGLDAMCERTIATYREALSLRLVR